MTIHAMSMQLTIHVTTIGHETDANDSQWLDFVSEGLAIALTCGNVGQIVIFDHHTIAILQVLDS